MTELNVNQLENLEGGTFWGNDCGNWGYIGGGCYIRTCKKKRFWITFSTYQELSGNC